MKIPLQDYRNRKRVIWFDIENGIYRTESFDWIEDVNELGCIGFATLFRSKFLEKDAACVYSISNTLYFQIRKNIWEIDRHEIKLRCKNINVIFRKFLISDKNTVEYSRIYLNPFFLNPHNLINWTYDILDAEQDDFFLWLANDVYNEKWIKYVKEIWGKGMKGPTEDELLIELEKLKLLELDEDNVKKAGIKADLFKNACKGSKQEITQQLISLRKWKKLKGIN